MLKSCIAALWLLAIPGLSRAATPTSTPSPCSVQGALASSLLAAPPSVCVGDEITVFMSVTNTGSGGVINLSAGALLTAGGGGAAMLSVAPFSANLAAGGSMDFTYRYTAIGPGALNFSGGASGQDAGCGNTVSSPPSTSNTITLLNCSPTTTETPVLSPTASFPDTTTPTVSPTATPSASPTASPTWTPTAAATASPTPSPQPAPAATPPPDFRILSIYPHPVPATGAVFVVSLPRPARLSGTLYDLRGETIWHEDEGAMPAGVWELRWGATNQSGAPVSYGTYYLEMKAEYSDGSGRDGRWLSVLR